MMKSEEDRLIEEIGQIIDQYSTALIRIKTDSDDHRDDQMIGSGTFISIDGQFGILTVQHVAAKLTLPCALGLVRMHEVDNFSIDSNHFTICEIAVPDKVKLEPDMAFINIHQSYIDKIGAYKKFVDLSVERQDVLENALSINRGAWFIWGVAQERITIEPPEGGFETVLGLHSLCSAAVASRETKIGEVDYIDIEVEYGKGFDVPKNFRGYSGGGIWQVIIEKSEKQTLVPTRLVFSGMTIYQSSVKDQKRYMHCHGRQSIYDYAYKKINANCA